jgi:hypothetical protein
VESDNRSATLQLHPSFEARVRRRRIDHQISAARSAIADRRFADAAATLDELFELDPSSPANGEIAAELAAAVIARRRRRLVPPVGAAAAAVGVVLGLMVGRQPQWSPAALLAKSPERKAAVLTSTPLPLVADTVAGSPPITARVDERTAIVGNRAPEVVEADVAEPPAAEPSAVDAAAPVPVMPAIDDVTLVREALQRYRRAYNGLDSRLAHAVYPGVDEAALAHAFEGLRSQSIEFDTCTLDTRTDSARAVCRGSARYLPKMGNTTPRSEPKVWTFRLEKNNGDWTITSAWTDR